MLLNVLHVQYKYIFLINLKYLTYIECSKHLGKWIFLNVPTSHNIKGIILQHYNDDDSSLVSI